MFARFLKTLLLLGTLICLLGSSLSFAQQPPANAPAAPRKPPVMKSIFWNTLLGSGWGALIGVAGALSQEGFAFGSLRESLVIGTTIGGLVGYGFGVFLVLQGISFDPQTIPFSEKATLTYQAPLMAPPVLPLYQTQKFQVALSSELKPVAIWRSNF